MSPEHERDLVERYPKLFAGYGAAPDKSAMAFGFECGDGWFDLLDTLCAQLSKLKPASVNGGAKTVHVAAEKCAGLAG